MERPGFDDVLAHYGVPGMKWGVRRTRKQIDAAPVQVKVKPGQKVQTKGGTGQKPSEDAIRVATSKQKAKASTTDSLSTKELQEMVNRMNLEQQYSKLSSQQKTKSEGQKLWEKYRDTEIDALKKGQDSPTLVTIKGAKRVFDLLNK